MPSTVLVQRMSLVAPKIPDFWVMSTDCLLWLYNLLQMRNIVWQLDELSSGFIRLLDNILTDLQRSRIFIQILRGGDRLSRGAGLFRKHGKLTDYNRNDTSGSPTNSAVSDQRHVRCVCRSFLHCCTFLALRWGISVCRGCCNYHDHSERHVRS